MLKKITLLAMAVAAVAAFAVPASASAASTHWTDNDVVVGNNVDITAPFEGEFGFTAGSNTYKCNVTIVITVTGPTSAEITRYEPTTGSCVGTGVFANCTLKAHRNNVPWSITSNATDLTIAKVEGNVTIKHEYSGCLVPSSHLEFPKIIATPTLNAGGTITSIALAGTSTTGAVESGSLAPEGSPTLGLVTVP